MTKPDPSYSVPGLERGLRLLALFSSDTARFTAPELERLLEVPRTTVFRLLVTLERLGFVERTGSGREYQAGSAVLKLGFEYLASLPLTRLGRPILEALGQKLGYSCNLVVRDEHEIVYLLRTRPATVFSSAVHIGTRLPAHATVLGRILLGNLTLDELRSLYPASRLPSQGANTPETVEQLYQLISNDRQRGYVIEEAFYESGISTVAAPIYRADGSIIAALGLTVPHTHVPEAERDKLLKAVRAAAKKLSVVLNETNQHPD